MVSHDMRTPLGTISGVLQLAIKVPMENSIKKRLIA